MDVRAMMYEELVAAIRKDENPKQDFPSALRSGPSNQERTEDRTKP